MNNSLSQKRGNGKIYDVFSGAFLGGISYHIWNDKDLPVWRSYTVKKIFTFDWVQDCKVSVDRAKTLYLRRPELPYLFDTLRNYY